ncbi:hypothetical protein OUZ56_027966 [Daphnia magna]|uniref:Uncharacterized protein n=1 Tax=Daphnia magna TaxID=35525 RepID=A0ABR0B2F9_9CRUS|nr:hypothetical protein OUZ56_027966 [Daphnia magna]
MLHYLCYSSEQRRIPLLWSWAFCLNIVRVTDNRFEVNFIHCRVDMSLVAQESQCSTTKEDLKTIVFRSGSWSTWNWRDLCTQIATPPPI